MCQLIIFVLETEQSDLRSGTDATNMFLIIQESCVINALFLHHAHEGRTNRPDHGHLHFK